MTGKVVNLARLEGFPKIKVMVLHVTVTLLVQILSIMGVLGLLE